MLNRNQVYIITYIVYCTISDLYPPHGVSLAIITCQLIYCLFMSFIFMNLYVFLSSYIYLLLFIYLFIFYVFMYLYYFFLEMRLNGLSLFQQFLPFSRSGHVCIISGQLSLGYIPCPLFNVNLLRIMITNLIVSQSTFFVLNVCLSICMSVL